MSVYFHSDEQIILVRGKTYPYRDLMRSLGGEYQAADKIWSIPFNAQNLQQIAELCKSVGGGKSKDPASPPQAASAPATGLALSATSPALAKAKSLQLSSARPLQELAGIAAETSLESKSNLADGMTISELMQRAQLVITQGFPRSLWVLGEIQNFRNHASGMYFQLADFKDGASRSATLTVNATLWRSQLADMERKLGPSVVRELLQDGLQVRLLVDVSLYKDRGQISLQVQGLDPNFTKGSLALAREKLLRELRAKGLDRNNKALPLPAFPLLVGLISAPDSRAQSDFLDQLQLYGFPGRHLFFPAQMQGEKTLEEVVKGLKALAKEGCDLIVLTRGGGSAADLRWFDSAEIAYAIAESPVPVVAAIGHHEDVCIAEEICFQREKTPTAAADFIVSLFQRTRERLDQLGLGLSRQLAERTRIQDVLLQGMRERILMTVEKVLSTYARHHFQLETAIETQVQRRMIQAHTRLLQLNQDLQQRTELRLQAQSNRRDQLLLTIRNLAEQRLQRDRQRLPHLLQQMQHAAQRSTALGERRLLELEKQIVQKDPQPWMAQGWTQLSGPLGRIHSAAELREGQQIRARLPDALLQLLVQKIVPSQQTPKHDPKQEID